MRLFSFSAPCTATFFVCVVRNVFARQAGAHIGDRRAGPDLEAEHAGEDHFGGGGHAHRVGAEPDRHLDFGDASRS